jgi:fumarylacetoacetase
MVGAWTGQPRVSGTWVVDVEDDHPFGIHNLPYGAAVLDGTDAPRLVVRIGDHALDLAAAADRLRPDLAALVHGPVLNPLLEAGRAQWAEVRQAIRRWLGDPAFRASVEPLLHPLDLAQLRLPVIVADYVDFFASEHHATNTGRLLRPNSRPLSENWKHLPIGYHGRAGTIVVSPTPIVRPSGQSRDASGAITFGPSRRLDFEAEVGFVLGGPTEAGRPVALEQAREHIFGVCLVNDWSARDIQSWETVPLGPFLGKSFATSVSPWIVPLEAFDNARVAPPARDIALSPYLDDAALEPWGLDIELRVHLNAAEIGQLPFPSMYWTAAQMLAHLTVNGATVRAGDLFASGTVSGPMAGQEGSLLERGQGFLADGDEVTISGLVPATLHRPELALGEVSGRVVAGR